MWSRNFTKCIDCESDARKHYGGGRCHRCYKKFNYSLNPDKYKEWEKERYLRRSEHIKAKTHEYYLNNHDKMLKACKSYRERKWFNSLRNTVLTRDNNTCQECQKPGIIIHHKDGNGRGSDNPNNSLDNLVTLCRSCHCKIHHHL